MPWSLLPAGVQIHNWSSDLENPDIPSIEFVAPSKAFVVTNGEKHYVDLHKVPALAPRQLQALAAGSLSGGSDAITDSAYTSGDAGSMLVEIPHAYLMKRLGGAIADRWGSASAGCLVCCCWFVLVSATPAAACTVAALLAAQPSKHGADVMQYSVL
jgi:hypothetical protein